MKLLLSVLVLFFLEACIHKPAISEDRVKENSLPQHIEYKYNVGDLDNDGKSDTAIVKYDMFFNPEECANPSCNVNVDFSGTIPSLDFDMSMGILVTETEDLNNDGINEILLFSRTFEGWWQKMYVYSFKNKKWTELAQGKAFCSDEKDFENRIIKKTTDEFALVTDVYNDETAEYNRTEIIFKIK